MKRWSAIRFFSIALISVCGCASNNWPTNDYVTVGKMMDTIKAPYVIDIQSNKKRLVFIGCNHNRVVNHPQFQLIGEYFQKVQPQLAFNEGGQIPDSVRFATVATAIPNKVLNLTMPKIH